MNSEWCEDVDLVTLKEIQRYLWAMLVVAGVTLVTWPGRDILTLANSTMFYLLAVLVIAIRWGTVAALAAAFVSFLCLNFFFVTPFYTLIVADPRELLDLSVFLIVAVLAGQLAARARQRAEDARQRAYEQEILYKLTRAFNQLTTREGVFEALTRALREDLNARDAHILPYATETISNDQTVYYLLLQADHTIYATLCVAFPLPLTFQQTQLVNTCASQAAMALHRIDLTERARKSQQFEESDRLKTAILHAVSHDLRTPITIIKSSASNLRRLRDTLSSDERSDIAETIEHEADHLDKLIGNLLDMSRLNAGALKLNLELNSLEEVAGDVAARAWQLSKQERIKIAFPDDLPLVSFDYGLLLQALTNIADNAVRYEPLNSQVEIKGCVQDQEVRLLVVNHGKNITDEERKHMMEPFYHSGGEQHVGLGLPIAKGIVEAHQGRIWVEDTPEGGATFGIALPLTSENVTHEAENPRR
jgi:two-component system sensor histidine kinase KdpD